ncbi:MAG: hypothetical protein Q8926_13110 [Bacteroidota bacterium]|nr:hypothetical protein [Bacteroidota bacterium]
MKRIFPFAGRLLCVLILLIGSNGCLKDKVTNTYQIQTPVYETLTQARSVIKAGGGSPLQAPGKIVVYKNYIFLNEESKGVHVVDNTNPALPKNISFINIPGNIDISVKDDILYADEAYGDLVAIDIKNPSRAVVKKYIPQIFNTYYNSGTTLNPDSVQVITGWITRDTTLNVASGNMPQLYYSGVVCSGCTSFLAAAPGANSGNGTKAVNGSTSAFAISNNDLYALSYGSRINVVDISSAANPDLVNQVNLTDYTQTIYPFGNKLFLGAYDGMSIFDISDPSTPVKQGSFAHVRTCDPVITDGQHAFVTLRSGTTCQGYTNELDVLDITDLSNPVLLKTYPLTNPRGLCKDGDLLFICDGTDGLKIYDAADINHLTPIKATGGFEANDVIAGNGIAIVLAADGLYQFDYSDIQNIHQISKIDVHAAQL